MRSPLLRTHARTRLLSSWSDLVRPSTSFDGQEYAVSGKLVDGRAKHDHDGVERIAIEHAFATFSYCHPGRAQREPGPMPCYRGADTSHGSRVAPLRGSPGMTVRECGARE